MWPPSQASKFLILLVLILVVIYCVFMDTLLYMRVQYYSIETFETSTQTTFQESPTTRLRALSYEDVVWIPCSVNPLCHPTVKALMVDHINHYIYGPLCAILDKALRISDRMLFLTPNTISCAHVFIAMIGANLLTCPNLSVRRMGIVLFQIRMFLDDLDGHVARERKHIRGERSEVGSLGYWVDGICDLIGVVAMMLGIFVYFKQYPPRRGYRGTSASALPYYQLKEMNAAENMEKDHASDVGISYKTKVSLKAIIQVIILFSGQMVLSSVAWNRYINVYQEMFENGNGYLARRLVTFRSVRFFCATLMWRILNPHSYLHVLSLAVFIDKTWSLLKTVRYIGYVLLLLAVFVTEYLISGFEASVKTSVDGR